MFYSEDIIEEVRSRNDIVDVVGKYVSLKRTGSNYMGLCPFHSEKSGSFSVSGSKQMYHCFGCGESGNVVTFLMKYDKLTFPEAIKELADRAGIKLPQIELDEAEKQRIELKNKLLEINREAAKFFVYQLNIPPGKYGKEYFAKRMLSEETQKKFGLGYSNIGGTTLYQYLKGKGYDDNLLSKSGLIVMNERGAYDRFRDRVMFPIMDVNNKVIGFGGRIIGEGEPKYLNSPETLLFDKGRNLYGMNYAKSSKKPNIILCEGYMDVIALHQAGFDQAVAALGTAFTPAHATLIKKYTNEVLMTFDSDGPGVKAAMRALPILKSAGLKVRAVDMRPHKDPDEFIKALGAEEFQKRLDNATNGFMYKIEKIKEKYDFSDPDDRTRFTNEVAKELAGFSEEVERENYISAVAREYDIGQDALTKLVNKIGNQIEMGTLYENAAKENEPKIKKDDGIVKSQQILLTWLTNEPELYRLVKKYISPEDFVDELYHKVAVSVYSQLEEKGKVNPAQIVNMFDKEEEHRLVSALFTEELKENITEKDREKVLNDTVINIMRDSLKHRTAKFTSLSPVEQQKLIKDRAELPKIKIVLG